MAINFAYKHKNYSVHIDYTSEANYSVCVCVYVCVSACVSVSVSVSVCVCVCVLTILYTSARTFLSLCSNMVGTFFSSTFTFTTRAPNSLTPTDNAVDQHMIIVGDR